MTQNVIKEEVFALNEKVHNSCQTIFKTKEEMLDRNNFVRSNDGDPDLIIYIPFNSQVNIKSMTVIGGEDGSSPAKVKLFTNKNENVVDFDLKDLPATHEITCIENREGRVSYFLPPNKFNAVWSLIFVVTLNHLADHTKVYYVGFEGSDKHKREKFKLELMSKTKFPEISVVKDEPNFRTDTIYG